VLVIAGDATLREFLAVALEDAGYAVEPAATAAAGLVAAAAAPPALIVLDLARAALAGAPFVAWYRRQPGPQAPLLLLSVRGEAETRTAAAALGACGALRLPFDLDDLLAGVARAVGVAPDSHVAGRPGPRAAPAALAPSKGRREAAAEAHRRRRLERLARDVWDLRPALAWVGHELQTFAAQEAAGRLSPEDAARVAVLRREHDALRRRLRAYQTEYARLRRGGGGRR
jgi:DNA-binding response OmpR family regulator